MKKIVYAFAAFAVLVVAVIGMSSFTSETGACGDASCHGKNCNYSVGCSCPGFSPTPHKEVYKQAICRHCHHHRSYHK